MHGLGWVIAASLVAGAGMGLISPALTVVVQNSVPVARMGSATTSQQLIRQVGAALGVSAFVLAATVGGMERLGQERHGRKSREVAVSESGDERIISPGPVVNGCGERWNVRVRAGPASAQSAPRAR